MCAGLEHYTWKNASLCDPPCRWRYCSFASTSSDSWRLPAEGAFHGGFSLLLIVRASVWTSTGICDESWCACVRVCVSVALPFICFVDCLCSEPSSFFFRLGANFKGDRILVLFFYFPPSNTISCSCASPSFCGPYGQRRIVYESLYTHLVKLLTRFLARVTHPLCISVCVCVSPFLS